jgi:hypothetical protein
MGQINLINSDFFIKGQNSAGRTPLQPNTVTSSLILKVENCELCLTDFF